MTGRNDKQGERRRAREEVKQMEEGKETCTSLQKL